MKFHITITDNETGEILHDADSDAILASIYTEETTATVGLVNCNLISLSIALTGLMKLESEIKESEPLAYLLAKDMSDKGMVETTEETTEETTKE